MVDYFEDHDSFYIVMERPEKYIDLFDYISEKRIMSERSARFLFRQVVEAIQYCMSVGVLHRDVKDENILIDLKTSQIKLIDFGSGTFLKDDAYTEYEGRSAYSYITCTYAQSLWVYLCVWTSILTLFLKL